MCSRGSVCLGINNLIVRSCFRATVEWKVPSSTAERKNYRHHTIPRSRTATHGLGVSPDYFRFPSPSTQHWKELFFTGQFHEGCRSHDSKRETRSRMWASTSNLLLKWGIPAGCTANIPGRTKHQDIFVLGHFFLLILGFCLIALGIRFHSPPHHTNPTTALSWASYPNLSGKNAQK